MMNKGEGEGMEEDMGMKNPLDEIIKKVDGYIANPKMVTPETLTEVRDSLVELKSYMDEDGESDGEGEENGGDSGSENGKSPSLTVMIGKMRNKGVEE